MNKDLITAEHNDARETRDEPSYAGPLAVGEVFPREIAVSI